MVEEDQSKYVVVALEVSEMLLIKVETPVNPITSTIKQTQGNLNTVWNCVGISEEKIRLHAEGSNKLGRAKDEGSATAHLLKKVSIDKMEEEKMNFETTFTQSLPVTLRPRGQLLLNYLKQHSNIILWNKQGQMIYKDDIIENSNMADLLSWMIKSKSKNNNQISPFVTSLFVKAIAECNVPLD